MKKNFVFVVVLLLAFPVFTVYCYKLRTNFNVDKLTELSGEQEYKIEVLNYALSLLPKENRNEVFFNSIRQKYPDYESNEFICNAIGLKKEVRELSKEEEEKKKEEEKIAKRKEYNEMSIPECMDVIIEE
jgi:hypothetical protein